METVSTPTFGSVGYFAALYREGSDCFNDVAYCMTGAVRSIIDYEHRTDADKVEFVRNALAAAELVRDELRQRA